MLASSTDELARVFRSEVSDEVTDQDGSDYGCLWKDWEVYGYMTEACDAVATRTDTSYRTIHLTFAAGDETVRLPPYLLEIREVRHLERDAKLDLLNANSPSFGEIDDYGAPRGRYSGLFGQTGRLRAVVRDYDASALRLVPTPQDAGTLEIQGTVTLAMPLAAGMPLPFQDVKDQRLVLDYMKAQAYLKQDAETEDLTRASLFDARFRDGVEARKVQLRNVRRAPPTVRMNW